MTRRDDERAEPPADRTPIATRAAAPRPRRLSRKMLAAISGVGALAVASALLYSLSSGSSSQAPQETVSVERRQAELLAEAPRDYSDLARQQAANLGPPASAVPATPAETPAVDAATTPAPAPTGESPEAQRRRQQQESARGSTLFAGNGGQRSAPPAPDMSATLPASPQPEQGATAPPHDRRAAFLAGGPAEPTVNSGRLILPPGRHVVTAGSTIAAALVTGLSSDLPGQVIAQVTEDVFDSATGRTRLIPQGARLIGTYDANVRTGQNRALVVWTRLILPDGRSLDLDRLTGTDASGQSGFADRVNNHWGTILRAGLLATLLGVGTQASGVGDNNAIADAIRDSAGQTVGRAGDRIVERELGVQPTITVRPGARVRVLVGRDLVMEAWPGR